VVIKNAKDKIALKKANKQLFEKLKSFYVEVSRYRNWLDDDQIGQFSGKELEP
jgi:hypothetical protein